MPHLLVPQMCRFRSCAPDVGKKLQHWYFLADVIQLSQMAAFHDLINLVRHAFSYPGDLTSFLEQFRKKIKF